MLFISFDKFKHINGPPGVWGIWGEWIFIFRELGSTCNYFRGAREHAHNLGGFREPCQKSKKKKKKKKKGKASILFVFLKSPSASDPFVNYKCIYFRTNMLIKIEREI